MKVFSFLSILFLSVFSVQSQNPDKILAWNEVDNIPKFLGCENSTSPDECSTQGFIDFVKKEFDHTLISDSNSDHIINFKIIIGIDGKLRWSSVKANNKSIKKEAELILKRLPLYTPGSDNDVPVNVVKSFVIKLEKQPEVYNIAAVDVPPTPTKCKKEQNKKICLSKWISNHVNSNFNPDVVQSKKSGTTIYKSTVSFVINKNGNVININASGENNTINQEAICKNFTFNETSS